MYVCLFVCVCVSVSVSVCMCVCPSQLHGTMTRRSAKLHSVRTAGRFDPAAKGQRERVVERETGGGFRA